MRTAQDRRLDATIAEVDRLRALVVRLRREVDWSPREIPLPSIRRLVEVVAQEFGVTAAQIVSDRRPARIVLPRQVVMWIAVQRQQHSLPRVGHCLLRDHTTVLHGVRAVTARMAEDPAFAARVDRVAAIVTTPLEAHS